MLLLVIASSLCSFTCPPLQWDRHIGNSPRETFFTPCVWRDYVCNWNTATHSILATCKFCFFAERKERKAKTKTKKENKVYHFIKITKVGKRWLFDRVRQTIEYIWGEFDFSTNRHFSLTICPNLLRIFQFRLKTFHKEKN